jgi:hypothetical protein
LKTASIAEEDMEKISEIVKAQQSGGSNALALPGTRQLNRDSLLQMGAMLRQMSGAFPHQEYDEETTKIFLLTFEDLALEYGLPPLEVALRRFLTRQKFFPHPSEVREELDVMAKKAKQEAQKQLPPLGCEECMPSGEGYRGLVLATDEKGFRCVKACACRLRRNRAKAGMQPHSEQYDAKAKAAGE